MMRVPRCLLLVFALSSWSTSAAAQVQVERNVVYGMYSGLALLMDVHHPTEPNGFGILCINGSGWSASLGYDSPQLNRRCATDLAADALLETGYTVFVASHRALPRFSHPAAVEDAQRAVRFIRANATEFGIDPTAIGAIGGSSGGHLTSMLGVLDGLGDLDNSDPVNRVSSKVQAVVAVSAPTDLKGVNTALGSAVVNQLLGGQMRPFSSLQTGSPEYNRYAEASPITYVTPDDPPFLIFHGDADQLIPFAQAQVMAAELRGAEVIVKVVPVMGGGHGNSFQLQPGDPQLVVFERETVEWFDTHLRGPSH